MSSPLYLRPAPAGPLSGLYELYVTDALGTDDGPITLDQLLALFYIQKDASGNVNVGDQNPHPLYLSGNYISADTGPFGGGNPIFRAQNDLFTFCGGLMEKTKVFQDSDPDANLGYGYSSIYYQRTDALPISFFDPSVGEGVIYKITNGTALPFDLDAQGGGTGYFRDKGVVSDTLTVDANSVVAIQGLAGKFTILNRYV